MANIAVTIYSAPWCVFCRTEKQYLDSLGVSYIVKDIEEDTGAIEELFEISGQKSVPITNIGGEIIRGFNRPKIDEALRANGLITV